MERTKPLRDYLKTDASIVGCAVPLLVLGVALMASGEILGIVVGLFLLGMGCMMIWTYYSNVRALNQAFQELERRGQLDGVLRDFAESHPVLNGELRLGVNYLYGRRCGHLLSYGQITKLYQYVHRTNFIEDRRELKVSAGLEKELTLCKLARKGKADEELKTVLGFILLKNPTIHIGYK